MKTKPIVSNFRRNVILFFLGGCIAAISIYAGLDVDRWEYWAILALAFIGGTIE